MQWLRKNALADVFLPQAGKGFEHKFGFLPEVGVQTGSSPVVALV